MSAATTFEEGVAEATFAIWQRYEPKPSSVNALTVVSNFFNGIADEAFGQDVDAGHIHSTWLADRFAVLGARGLWGEVIPTNLVRPKLTDVAELVCRKQHDYGHGNILRFGADGIIVRLSDKLARLENLLRTDRTPSNEAITDTWDDIIGYSIIAYMLITGTFLLPLAADVPRAYTTELPLAADVVRGPATVGGLADELDSILRGGLTT